MPQSDFLIGFNSGNAIVGDVIGDKQRQAQLDLAKAQMEMDRSFKQGAMEQNASELALRKKMLDEQSRHRKKLEEAHTFDMESAKINRDWKVEDREARFKGLARAKEFDNELSKSILEDPTGAGFFKKGVELRLKYSDLFSHQSDEVQAKAQTIYLRGTEFLKSADVGARNKELAELETRGHLNPNEREDAMAQARARQARDKEDAEAMAAASGVTLEQAIGAKAGTPELDSLGGWTPAYKAMVSKGIASLSKAKSDQSAPIKGQIKLNIPAGAIDPETGRPATDPLTGKVLSAGEITVDVSELQRSPFLRSIAEKTLGRSGMTDLLKSSQVFKVQLQDGTVGTMSAEDYETNILRGNKVTKLSNQP